MVWTRIPSLHCLYAGEVGALRMRPENETVDYSRRAKSLEKNAREARWEMEREKANRAAVALRGR
jgi:hypothetical protein